MRAQVLSALGSLETLDLEDNDLNAFLPGWALGPAHAGPPVTPAVPQPRAVRHLPARMRTAQFLFPVASVVCATQLPPAPLMFILAVQLPGVPRRDRFIFSQS